MKTSELRELLKNHGEPFRENEICFESEESLWYVFKEEKAIAIYGGTNETVAELLSAYYLTPIENRKAQRKYYIMCSVKGSGSSTLRLLSTFQGYYLHEMTYTYFTEEGIESLPIEIQKAIECGFLKKVEVES
jgi:hypothetical protein